MAQLVKEVDCKSLLAKCICPKPNQEKESCNAFITAKELSIAWGENPQFWKWEKYIREPSFQSLDVAEMIGDCCLQIDGTYPAMDLIKGRKYIDGTFPAMGLIMGQKHEVYFVIELRDHDGILTNRRVTLRLTGPDGTTHEHQEDLTMKPRNELIQLKVGEFKNVTHPGDKNVKFSLHGCDDTTWKGFTIIGAIICEPLPKPFI